MNDEQKHLEEAVAAHYAREQAGLPPPLEPHPGYATLVEAWVAHRKWLATTYPHHDRSVPVTGPPVVLPEPLPEP